MNNTTSDVLVLPDYIAWTSLVLCSIVLAVGVLGKYTRHPYMVWGGGHNFVSVNHFFKYQYTKNIRLTSYSNGIVLVTHHI